MKKKKKKKKKGFQDDFILNVLGFKSKNIQSSEHVNF